MGLKRRLEDALERIEEETLRDPDRDERDERHEAVMAEMRKTPEGREAVARLGELYAGGGGTLEVLRSEEGRGAVGSFRDELFAAQDRIRNDEQGGNG